jgi:hypothetical protein
MGPVSAKSYPGKRLVRKEPGCARAKQEIDYGLRGKGYVFGAFRPADGQAYTFSYERRDTASYVDFLSWVDTQLEIGDAQVGNEHTDKTVEVEHVYAIVDNLQAHRSADAMLFSATHPRWEFIFQPVYAAYLNLIEPWWKVLRSLALQGRRFDTWAQISEAVSEATRYWNAHRHPFVWGKRKRHRLCSPSSLAIAS